MGASLREKITKDELAEQLNFDYKEKESLQNISTFTFYVGAIVVGN
jgi:hypothetical protein